MVASLAKGAISTIGGRDACLGGPHACGWALRQPGRAWRGRELRACGGPYFFLVVKREDFGVRVRASVRRGNFFTEEKTNVERSSECAWRLSCPWREREREKTCSTGGEGRLGLDELGERELRASRRVLIRSSSWAGSVARSRGFNTITHAAWASVIRIATAGVPLSTCSHAAFAEEDPVTLLCPVALLNACRSCSEHFPGTA